MRLIMLFSLQLVVGLNTMAQTAVMDRVAVIVGRRVVKLSDIDRDLRASEFLNRQKLDVSDAARKKAAERLIDQEMIRQEIQTGRYSQPGVADIDSFAARLRQDRFGGSDPQFQSALAQYGLTPERFREYLKWQLTVLRFIDERFRPGVLVTDEDVSAYYNEHRAELVKANPKGNSLQALDASIRETIAAQRVNEAFDEWLKQTRDQTRVQYRPAAFGEQPTSVPVVKKEATER